MSELQRAIDSALPYGQVPVVLVAPMMARLAAVEALHTPNPGHANSTWCDHDGLKWPCPTIAALHPDPSEAGA